MSEQNKKMELLGNAPVPRALLAMGLPMMIGMMINAVYNLADAYFVGGLGTSQMGAISVAFPLGQVVVGLGLLFGNGAASFIPRLLGKGDRKTADQAASTALYGSIISGMVMILVSMIFMPSILRFLGATESIMSYAKTYTSIYIVSCIFNVFNVAMNNIVTSEGAARTAMCALLSGALLNMILDPVFIYMMGLGVAGAAIATAVSQVVSTFVYLFYILRGKSAFSFYIGNCSFSREILTEIFKIGIPTLIFQLLTSLSITLINIQAKEYGDSVIAGMGTVTRIISMGSLMVFGFLKGFQPIAGFSYGDGKIDRLKEAIRTAVLWSTVFCTFFGVVAILFAEGILSRFTERDVEMIQVGAKALRANGVTFILFGFYTVHSNTFLALGKGLKGFILGACRQGVCFVPAILLLPALLGVEGIIYAQPAADLLSFGAAAIMAIGLKRELSPNKQ